MSSPQPSFFSFKSIIENSKMKVRPLELLLVVTSVSVRLWPQISCTICRPSVSHGISRLQPWWSNQTEI